jgi:WD40 repeat protein
LTAAAAGPDPVDDHGFPWEFRPGTELVERWSLPDAAGRPEFGLPPLPEQDLPEQPFRNLGWFTAKEADIFFGRGYQVRELYKQLTDPSGPPILLLYGASGVGKSSLLDAGLVPRLESAGHLVRYRRRDQQKGLVGCLSDALAPAEGPGDLRGRWRAEEPSDDKALFLFLDQVEEVFTRPDPGRPRELDELIAVLGSALGDREKRPRGKLVLGFRKEWLAELDRRFAEAKLPRAKMFLEPLDRRGIIEAIRGPARPGRLEQQYRLAIEDGLPEVIADDLLADAGSAVAPTLEVFLTRMWDRARQADPDRPRFDRRLYESLKAEGYLLKDVLDEGLKAIRRWKPAVEESGLALDVLAYHTTELGYANECDRARLTKRYKHRDDVLDGLLACCKERYLIVDAGTVLGPSTRLAHDLLGPLVLRRFRLSIAPGQRARRLLENRAPDWRDGKTGAVLDETDLATVEAGASGMRAWDAEAKDDHAGETRLIEASRRARARRRFLRRSLQIAAAVAIMAVCVSGSIAWVFWGVARRQTEEAIKQAGIADKRARIAAARQLTLVASHELERLEIDLALLLSAHAIGLDPSSGWTSARGLLYETLTAVPGKAARVPVIEGLDGSGFLLSLGDKFGHGYGISALSFTPPHGKTLTIALKRSDFGPVPDGIVLWDLATNRPLGAPKRNREGPWETPDRFAFSPDGKTLAACSSNSVVLWRTVDPGRLAEPIVLDVGSDGGPGCVAFSPDGRRLAIGMAQRKTGQVKIWDVRSGSPQGGCRTLEKDFRSPGDNLFGCECITFSPDGLRLAAGFSTNGSPDFLRRAVIWELPEQGAPKELVEIEEGGAGVAFIGDGGVLMTGVPDGIAFYLGKSGASYGPGFGMGKIKIPNGPSSMDVSRDGRTLAVGTGDGVALFDIVDGAFPSDKPQNVVKTGGGVQSIAFDEGGTTLAVGVDGRIALWDVAGRRRLRGPTTTTVDCSKSLSLAFGPDGMRLAYDSDKGVALGKPAVGRIQGDLLSIAEASDRPASITLSPDGQRLAVGFSATPEAPRNRVVLWDVSDPSSPSRLSVVDLEEMAACVAFRGDGAILAASDHDGVTLRDTTGGTRVIGRLKTLNGRGGIFALAWDRDGTRLAVGYGSSDGRTGGAVAIVDVGRDVALGAPLEIDEGAPVSLAFGAEGGLLAIGFRGPRAHSGVILWDLMGRRRLREPLSVTEGSVTSVAFSPDGSTLATGYLGKGSRGGVLLWDLDLSSWLRRASEIVGRNLSWDEWRLYFGTEVTTYTRTFPGLPDGPGVSEVRRGHETVSPGPPLGAGGQKSRQ